MLASSPRPFRLSHSISLVAVAGLIGATSDIACGNGSENSTSTQSFGGSGGAGTGTGMGTAGHGGTIFGLTTSHSASSGTGSTGTMGTGGTKPVCDGSPTTGPQKWVEKNNDDGGQYALGVTSDAAGNAYVTGSYSGTFTIGGKTADVTGASNALFVAKIGSDGTVAWVHGYAASKTGVPNSLVTGRGIAVDLNGAVYVVGDFTGLATFGSKSMTSAGNFFGDSFLLKLNATGDVVNAVRLGDPASTPASGGTTVTTRAVALSGTRVAVVGDAEGILDIGSNITVTGSGTPGAYLAVFDTGLTPQYVKLFSDGTVPQSTHGVTFDTAGDVVVTGNTTGAITFPGGSAMTPTGTQATFLAKLKGDGTGTVWAKLFGAGTSGGEGVAIDPSGDIFITGDHKGAMDFGGGGTIDNANGANVFVAKLDAMGGHVWSYSFGDPQAQHALGIGVDAMGRAVIVGQYTGKIDFGGGPLASAGGDDGFIAKLDTHGCQVWAKSFGDIAEQTAAGVAVDATGNAVVAGSLAGTVSFGATMLTGQGTDAFVARFGP
jgi:hypothetical protein